MMKLIRFACGPIFKLRSATLVLLVLFQWNCTRNAELTSETSYFLRVVLINDKPPIARLFKASLKGLEVKMPVSGYTVEITSSSGQTEKMTNGIFSSLKCIPGVKYTIRWKRKEENQWHQMEETLPKTIDLLEQKNLVIDQNNIRIAGINNVNNDAFFLDWNYYPQNGDPKDLLNVQWIPGFFTTGQIEKELYINNKNELIIWPPKINPGHSKSAIYSCLKPFSWHNVYDKKINSRSSNDLVVCQMNSDDFKILRQIETNFSQVSNPLYLGKSIPFQYALENNYGHVFSINRYDVRMDKVLPKDNPVTYKLLYKGQPLDTQNIQIRDISVRLWDQNNLIIGLRKYAFGNPTDTLFFEDYIASAYNEFADLPCGNMQSSYMVSVYIVYFDKKLNFEQTFDSPIFEYKRKSEQLIIDIQ